MEPKKSIFKYALGVILGVLAFAGMCSISGCGGGGGGSSEAVSSVTPSPMPNPAPVIPDITPTDTNGVGLPLKTRQYIEATYPESARKRAALFQYAKATEAELADAKDEAKSIQHGQEYMGVSACLWYTFGSVNEASEARLSLDPVILDSDERTLLYLEYNSHLGARVYHSVPYDQRASACTINPATLPN